MRKYLQVILAFISLELLIQPLQFYALGQDFTKVNEANFKILSPTSTIEIYPSSLDFGLLKPGETSVKDIWLINLTNSNTFYINYLFLKTNNQGFEVLTKNLAQITVPFTFLPHDSINFKVKFINNITGTFNDTISVSDNTQNYDLCNLTALVNGPIIDASSQIFNDTYIGNSITKQLTIYNLGTLDMSLKGYQIPDTSVFIVQLPEINPIQTLTIAPGKYYAYNVTFKPKEEKEYLDSIVFASTALIGNNVTILKGRGLAPVKIVEENTMDDNAIYIYPNPAQDKLTIQSNNIEIFSLKIFDIYGDVLDEIFYGGNTQNINYNTSKLANGLYIVQLNTGKRIITKTFIIMR
ncbi:MAG: T9SS type A sorting domain-containing protein [FCB group bacterium]|jgi:hypothetical protein